MIKIKVFEMFSVLVFFILAILYGHIILRFYINITNSKFKQRMIDKFIKKPNQSQALTIKLINVLIESVIFIIFALILYVIILFIAFGHIPIWIKTFFR